MDKSEKEQPPFWFMLLDNWVNKEQNSGLSIPFLIGAKYEYITDGLPDEEAIELLFENIMTHQILKYCAGLTYCDTIKAYILTIVPREEIDAPFFTHEDGRPALVLLDQAFGKNVSLEWIVTFLKTEYSEPILSGKYSRKNSASTGWERFNEKDIKQIKTSFNII